MFNMFCPKCKSLLFPRDGILTCNRCGYQKKGDTENTFIVTRSIEREFLITEEKIDTLPTEDIECSKCGNKKAYWVLRQMRAADEPETRIFRCTSCSHCWREN